MSADHPVSVVPILQFLSDFSLHYPLEPEIDDDDEKEENEMRRKEGGGGGGRRQNFDSSLRILLYSGEFDLNCNTLGTLHTLEANLWRNRYSTTPLHILYPRSYSILFYFM